MTDHVDSLGRQLCCGEVLADDWDKPITAYREPGPKIRRLCRRHAKPGTLWCAAHNPDRIIPVVYRPKPARLNLNRRTLKVIDWMARGGGTEAFEEFTRNARL